MQKPLRLRAVLSVALVAALLCLPVMLRARETARPQAVVTGGAAYILGTPVQIVAGAVQEYSVSPDGRYVLVISGSPTPPKMLADLEPPPAVAKRHTFTLSLYEARTGRTRVLRTWNDLGTVSRYLIGSEWLIDSDTAMLLLMTESAGEPLTDSNTDLLLVHCARQSVQVTPLPMRQSGSSYVYVRPSPTRPEAIIGIGNDVTNKINLRLVSAKGIFGATMDAGGEGFGFHGWDKTGDRVLLSRFVKNPEEMIGGHLDYVLWSRGAGQTTPLKSRPVHEGYDFAVPPYVSLVEPLRFVTERGSISTTGGAKGNAPCAVAVGADGKERVVVASNAEAATVVGKPESPVLIYDQHDALYAVPVRSVTETAFSEYLRKEAEASVKTIGLSIQMYIQDYDEQLPVAAHDVASDLSPYLRSEETFFDARTGANAFTYTYTGTADAVGRKPLFTFKTSTGTYRAFWMPDGKVVTEPPVASPKP